MKVSITVIVCSLVFCQLLLAKTANSQISATLVKISFGKESLQSSISKLEKQTGIKFSYNPEDLKGYSVKPNKFKEEKLSNILNYLFSKTQLAFKEISDGIVIYDKTATLKTSSFTDKSSGPDIKT
jgi:hypothetical protein